jgi:transcriptional regulator with XRE-family HTH domain
MATKVEPFYTDVGHRIRDHRNKAGMTQERLGRLLSPPTTRVSIANIEGGNQRILSHTLVQLAAALNIEVTEILPPKPETSVANNNSQITDELVTKLGISVSAAKKLAGKAKKSLNPWERL